MLFSKIFVISLPYFIGLYRENANAIQKESGHSNGGKVLYVTMRITFNIPEFMRNERNSHCDVLHITPIKPGLHFERKSTAHTQTILRTWGAFSRPPMPIYAVGIAQGRV